jgi:hypothetical protein
MSEPMSEPMSDARIEHISGCLSAPCDVNLTWAFAHELLDDVKRARAELAELHTEYGARVTYTDTLTAEGPIADTLDEALEALADFDAKGHANVVSRKLVQRPVGDWRELDTAQQPEDGDRG